MKNISDDNIITDIRDVPRHVSQLRRVVDLFNIMMEHTNLPYNAIVVRVKYQISSSDDVYEYTILMRKWSMDFDVNIEAILVYRINTVHDYINHLLSGKYLLSSYMTYLNNLYINYTRDIVSEA